MPAHVRLASRSKRLSFDHLRVDPRSNPSETRNVSIIILAVVIAAVLCISLAAYFILRFFRLRHCEPTYIPTTWLKRKWSAWTPSSDKRRMFRSLPTDGRAAEQRSRTLSTADPLNTSYHPSAHDGQPAAELSERPVDRHTSLRSIMTLPPYSADVRPTEQIIGREGERAGVDTVVDFPETVDEEEERRDGEMETMYQIRRARREERVRREERRQLRREARARGDTAAVEELRAQDRLAASAAVVDGNMTSEGLISEHRSRERGRRVSSVSYMDLGVARHDGSRVRNVSGDSGSDRRPLMESAAQMGGSGASGGSRDRSTSARSGSRTFRTHLRNISTSSLSRFMTPDISDDDSADFEMVPPGGRDSRATSLSLSFPRPRLRLDSSAGPENRPGSEPITNNTTAVAEPPQYDALSPIHDNERRRVTLPDGELAPAYESPTDAPRIPGFARLPSIRVTPFTPDVVSAGSAADWPSPQRDGDRETRA